MSPSPRVTRALPYLPIRVQRAGGTSPQHRALRVASVIVSSWALLRSGEASAQPRVPTHVACVGDSITAGAGASSPSTDYPSDLQKLLGPSVQVQNFGHSGATMLSTGDLPYIKQPEYTNATTFVSKAGANAVVDVIIMLGTNDSKPFNWTTADGGTSAAQFQSDCAAMVDHFASLPTRPVVYLALPPTATGSAYQINGAVLHDAILPVIAKVAMQKGAPVIDINTPTAGQPQLFVDGVHPNDMGYALIARLMRDALLLPLAGDGGVVEAGSPESGAGESGVPGPEAGGPETGASLADSSVLANDATGPSLPDSSVPLGYDAAASTESDAGTDATSPTSGGPPGATSTRPNGGGGCILVAHGATSAMPFASIAALLACVASRRRRLSTAPRESGRTPARA
jgi:lysophospholipase L1-like esterase